MQIGLKPNGQIHWMQHAMFKYAIDVWLSIFNYWKLQTLFVEWQSIKINRIERSSDQWAISIDGKRLANVLHNWWEWNIYSAHSTICTVKSRKFTFIFNQPSIQGASELRTSQINNQTWHLRSICGLTSDDLMATDIKTTGKKNINQEKKQTVNDQNESKFIETCPINQRT